MVWNEQDHPRDDIGRFTFKDGGTIKGGIEKTQGGGKFSDLFNGFSLSEIKDLLLNVVTTALPTALKIGMGVFQLKNIIEANNLEKELMKEIKIARVRKEERKNNKEETIARLTTNNRIGLSNKTTNTVNNKPKVKETAKDVLYGTSQNERQQKLKDNEYKNKLLDILGDKATQADVLYSTPKELEEKIREYGLGNKLKEVMTGGAANINNNQNFTRPVEGIIKSDYGPRKAPVPNGSTYHKGIDFRAPIGTPVKSIASGTVIKAGSASGYGIAVYVDHGIINGKHVISEYGHLSKCNVKVGDKINAGQVVAKSGNSGRSSGPHLHLTIKENGQAVDPKKYIKLK